MGYSTEYMGRVTFQKKLDEETATFLKKFASTRRMKRTGLPKKYGVDGEYYVDGKGPMGQDTDETVVDQNRPPRTQPGLWCQWIPTKDLMGLEWDGGEKFYNGYKWMKYILERILAPKGYVANGVIEAQGEDMNDRWTLKVINNEVSVETLEEKLQKDDLFDIITTKDENLPLLINTYTNEKTKEALQNRFNGKLSYYSDWSDI